MCAGSRQNAACRLCSSRRQMCFPALTMDDRRRTMALSSAVLGFAFRIRRLPRTMYTLTSDSLEVAILDPLADQERFGTRYCTGGYIFQITDHRHGALLSGPTYPDSFNWFDGQGIPDAFNLSPLREPTAPDASALIIGVGVCDLRANQVAEFCQWEVQQHTTSLVMRTSQAFQGFALELERAVA